MKALKLKEHLSEYLRNNGTEDFTKLVSDAIDEAAPNKKITGTFFTRKNFVARFNRLTRFNSVGTKQESL